MFIKGFSQGPGRSHSGPQRGFLGPRNAKRGGIRPFLQNWLVALKSYRVALKNDQETIGLRKVLGMGEMMIFSEIPEFYQKF